MKGWMLFSWLPIVCMSAVAAEQGTLDPNAAYQAVRTNPVTYEVDLRVVVTVNAG